MKLTYIPLVIFFITLLPLDNAKANSDAVTMVEQLHAALLFNMQHSKSLGYQGRYDNLSPLIDNFFDFPLIAKVILSRHWNKLSEAKQQSFTEQLRELTKSTYAARFHEYIDEQFITSNTESLKKGRLLVKTEIHSAEEDTVSLNYLVHPVKDNWKIISVIANGVNDLSLKRAEYATIIREHGFDELQQQIAVKIKEHEDL